MDNPLLVDTLLNTFMSMADIEKQFDNEWVLLEDPETTDLLKVTRGKLLWHSKDRDEIDRKSLELRPKSSAIPYIGKRPAEVVYML